MPCGLKYIADKNVASQGFCDEAQPVKGIILQIHCILHYTLFKSFSAVLTYTRASIDSDNLMAATIRLITNNFSVWQSADWSIVAVCTVARVDVTTCALCLKGEERPIISVSGFTLRRLTERISPEVSQSLHFAWHHNLSFLFTNLIRVLCGKEGCSSA